MKLFIQRFLSLFSPCSILMTADVLAESDKFGGTNWDYTAALGASFTSGNSDSLTYSAQFLATYQDQLSEASYGFDYFFEEYSGYTTTNSLNIFGDYKKKFTDKFYLGIASNIYTNEVSNVDYRVDTSTFVGYYFFRDERRLLSAELGVGYAWESKNDEADGFLTYRAAQHFDYQLGKKTTIRQSAILTPKATDPSTYIFTFGAGVDIRLKNQWNFRTTLNHRIDLSPAVGKGKDDTILTVGLSYSLNGFLKEKEERADTRRTLKKKIENKEGTRMGWIRNVALTTNLSGGNSESLNFQIDYDSAYRSKTNEFFLKSKFQFAESDGESQQNRLNASTRYNWKLNPYTYAGIGLGFLHDDAADLKFRISPGAHIGRYFILTNMGGFSLETGLAYTMEKRGGFTESYLSVQAAQRLYWQISSHTYITQEIAYDAPAEQPSEFNINSYLYLDTILSESFAWRFGLEYYYNSTPAAGAVEGDFSVNTGIAMRF